MVKSGAGYHISTVVLFLKILHVFLWTGTSRTSDYSKPLLEFVSPLQSKSFAIRRITPLLRLTLLFLFFPWFHLVSARNVQCTHFRLGGRRPRLRRSPHRPKGNAERKGAASHRKHDPTHQPRCTDDQIQDGLLPAHEVRNGQLLLTINGQLY